MTCHNICNSPWHTYNNKILYRGIPILEWLTCKAVWWTLLLTWNADNHKHSQQYHQWLNVFTSNSRISDTRNTCQYSKHLLSHPLCKTIFPSCFQRMLPSKLRTFYVRTYVASRLSTSNGMYLHKSTHHTVFLRIWVLFPIYMKSCLNL